MRTRTSRRRLKLVPFEAGEALRAWRLKAGLSQEEASDAVGVSQATWADWERCKKQPRIEHAIRISKLTGLPVDIFARPLPKVANGN